MNWKWPTCSNSCSNGLTISQNPFDPFGTPMTEKVEKRLNELLEGSMVVNLKTKNERIVKIAFVSECCRVKRDKYFSSVELPACKRVKMRGNL